MKDTKKTEVIFISEPTTRMANEMVKMLPTIIGRRNFFRI